MKKTNVPPFDETPAPKTSLHPNETNPAFHDSIQPLGVHFEAFLADFVFGYIPEKRQESMDSNSARARRLLLEAEKVKIRFDLVGAELLLHFKLGEEGEEWTLSI